MRRLRHLFAPLTILLAVLVAGPALAESGPRQVRVALDAHVTLEQLLREGLDVIHVDHGRSADVYEWPGDDARLARLGAAVTLIDADPGATASARNARELAARGPTRGTLVRTTQPDGSTRTDVLPNFGDGSLGGFWTLAEVKLKLDQLVSTDTRDLINDKIDTLGFSLQGRPIWALTIGKRVTGPDTRPVVFYSALTHAREPEGMQALLYFVDDLLGAYDSDPLARYLLEKRRIVICPVVNPDGYRFNQQIHDTTTSHAFGLWRKNLRDNNNDHRTNAGTTDGVDLNRNYGFKWGLDNIGSSPTSSNDTYRGPSAFSEPETRVQRDAFSALQPIVGISFHTYGDLFVHPWGWTTAGTPDSAKFQEWSDEMTMPNGFTSGPAPRILYSVNGEFNDWTYGDTLLKPRAFTWTPEIGTPNDGFWPSPARIIELASLMSRSNWTLAGIAGPWLRAERTSLLEGALPAGGTAHVSVRLRNLGATGVAGPSLSARLTAIDPEAEVLTGPIAYPDMPSFTSSDAIGGATFQIAAADTVTPGRLVHFKLEITDANGTYCRDTLSLAVGVPTTVLLESFDALARWNVLSGPWGLASDSTDHPSRYLSDSPGSAYPSGNVGAITLKQPLDLSAGVHAYALLEDRWQFESDYDCALFEASLDSLNWTPLAGNGTTTSAATSRAGAGLTVFDGTRWRWREDRFDLSAFAGGAAADRVRLRLRSLSDAGLDLDGLNLDSLRVIVYDPALQPAPVAVPHAGAAQLRLAPPAPNPARGRVRLEFAVPAAGSATLEILDIAGRRVFTHTQRASAASAYAWGWDLRDAQGRAVPAGVYLVRLTSGAQSVLRRLVVLP